MHGFTNRLNIRPSEKIEDPLGSPL